MMPLTDKYEMVKFGKHDDDTAQIRKVARIIHLF